MNNWKIKRTHQLLLDDLLGDIEIKSINKILDVGSGRTSLRYLTDKFPSALITAVVYPGDDRKILPIKEFVKNTNYNLYETDFCKTQFTEKYDIILAHLFLGEIEKFGKNKFKETLEKLLSIQTKFLAIIDIEDDPKVDFELIFSHTTPSKIKHIQNDEEVKYIGILVKA